MTLTFPTRITRPKPGPRVAANSIPSRARSTELTRPWLATLSTVAILALGVGAGLGPLYGVAALIGVAAMIYLARRPVTLCLVAVAAVPVTSGLARGVPIPGFRISELTIVFGAVVVLLIQARRMPGPQWTTLDRVALAYCFGALVFGVVDVMVHQVTIASDDLQTMIGPIQFFLVYRTLATGLITHRARILALRLCLLASLPVSLLAIAQQAIGQSVTNALVSVTGTTVFNTPGFEPVFRATSVFPIWHALGGYLLVILLLSAGLLLAGDHEVLPPWAHCVVISLGAVAMVLTLTITVAVGALFGVVLLGWFNGRLRQVVTWMAVTGGIALFVFYPLIANRIAEQSITTDQTPGNGTSLLPQTLQYRVGVWLDQYLPALNGSWLTGYGPAQPPGIDWHHTESGFITILLRGGLPYLILTSLLIVVVGMFAWTRMNAAINPAERGLAGAILALAIVFPVINLFFPYITASGLAQPMWVLWGILAASGARKYQRTSRESTW